MSKISLSPSPTGSAVYTIASPAGSTDRTLNLPDAAGTIALQGGTGVGKVLQVVQGSTSTPATSSSTTFADTGLSATITPTSATSKILILVSQNGCGKNTNNVQLRLRLLREATSIVDIERNGGFSGSSDANFIGSCSVNFLDSPATTSATTYKTQFSSGSASASVLVQSDSGGIGSTSTITLMEIAA